MRRKINVDFVVMAYFVSVRPWPDELLIPFVICDYSHAPIVSIAIFPPLRDVPAGRSPILPFSYLLSFPFLYLFFPFGK